MKGLLWVGLSVVAICAIIVAMGVKQGVNSAMTEGAKKGIEEAQQNDARAAQQAYATAIRDVIRQDVELSNAMNAAINAMKVTTASDFDKIAAQIENYVEQAKQIDTGACPREFAEAYYRHLAAWSEEGRALKDHPDVPTDEDAFAEGFFRGLAGDPTGGVFQRQDEMKAWYADLKAKDTETHKSWDEVQAVAVRYGV
jgi:hypothetical protein